MKCSIWKAPMAALAAVGLFAATMLPAFAESIQIRGSDTVLPLAQAWSEAYMKKNPSASIGVTGGGSGVGIAALINGTVDIADASRRMKGSEAAKCKAKSFLPVEHKVALDGLSIIVHPDKPLKSLTVAQVGSMFTGKVTNWKSVGGPDGRVVAGARQSTSGTYSFFQKNVMKGGKYKSCQHLPSNNAICQVVARSKGGIGYVGLAYAEKWGGKVKIIPVAKSAGAKPVMPSEATVRDRSYPIWRYLYNYTAGAPRGLVKAYLDFVKGAEGQAIVPKVGYISLK